MTATATDTIGKPEMLVCDVCKRHGHVMYIYLNEYVDSHNRNKIMKRYYNYYSRTRHYHMYPGGKDF